jgi:DNA-binding NarL/FixJ family response regulator
MNEPDRFATVHVLIIEDNPLVREAWGTVVGRDDRLVLAGSFGSCEDALASGLVTDADVVLMDIGLPGMSGIEGIRHLKNLHPDILVIMCTVFEDDDNIFSALCAGAVGYVVKKTSPDDVRIAIHDAVAGGSPMSPSIARKVIQSFHLAPGHRSTRAPHPLTEREQEVLSRLVQGKSYFAIAAELFLSVDGVRYHLRHIYEKLQVSTRAEAVARGLKDRLVPPPR